MGGVSCEVESERETERFIRDAGMGRGNEALRCSDGEL